MKIQTLRELVKAKKSAEMSMGFAVDNVTAREVLEHCIRKCKCANKDEDYLPIMYRYELPMQIEAKRINEISLMYMKERRESKCAVNV